MPEQFIRVVLAEGDEVQLADIDPDDYVEFGGTINGQPIPVRFYRPEPDSDDEPAGQAPADPDSRARLTAALLSWWDSLTEEEQMLTARDFPTPGGAGVGVTR